jgi:uncharacterized surface protein with fasciclin (FAS1) repeats
MINGRLGVLAALTFAAWTSHAAAQQCSETFFSAASKDPSLGLLTTAVSSLSPSQTTGIIPSPDSNITVFAPTDDAFLALFQSQGLTLGSVSTLTTKLTSVLLQHVLLNATTTAQLMAGGRFQSALGTLLNQSFPITAKETDGNVTVAGRANTTPANVLRTIPVCTSYVHVVDAVLLPASNISAVPSVSVEAVQAAAAGLGGNSTAGAPAGSPADAPGSSPSSATVPAPAALPPPPPPNSASIAAPCTALLSLLLLAVVGVSVGA